MPAGGGWAGAAAYASMAALGFSGMALPVRFTALGTAGAQEPKRLKDCVLVLWSPESLLSPGLQVRHGPCCLLLRLLLAPL